MENEQWLLNRTNGLGGSDAAVVLGISPFKSRLQLWHEKVNKTIDTNSNSNLIFDIGHALEPVIANHYTKMTGRVLEICPQKIHSKYPFITGNIDRKIVKSERESEGILEIKTKGDHVNWHNEEIPIYYMAQIQQYLEVYGYSWAGFAVLDLGKREITITDVERDDEFIENLIMEEAKFWDLVQNKTPPKIEPTVACEEFLEKYFNTSEPTIIDLSGNKEATQFAEKLNHVKVHKKELENIETECKTYFMNEMKEAEKCIGDGYTITWKNDRDSEKFDTDKFKQENKELYKKYLEPKKGSRRFLSKFDKE